ncbi:zinc-finger domain of monoamine-oxidase A repressor R1 protein [Actinidia rufa]|uniref:Zinc-finger domain of monoamine-oxidase A repressor R1 protein n=1 Tax=Actinidia rufa TaxID=165716 RepID=A0A7J0E943_9ERIC|nr:zinc-finger domain of monoamine-oxidase A repressor R1 protein [Actinidia rufa]
MAVDSTPASEQKTKISKSEKKKREKSRKQSKSGCNLPRKRKKCPGVRLVGGRIYDSENGKTCHQCRQKTMDFTASCKNQKKDKPCTIKFCHKCLLNRYGENAEEMAVLKDWNCPKCRGICNCSFCMKKRGHRPTGILVHTAKATGFSSVSELLDVKGPEIDKIVKAVGGMPLKDTTSNNEPSVEVRTKRGKENTFSGNCDSNLRPLPSSPNERKLTRMKGKGLKEKRDGNQDDGVFLLETNRKKPRITYERLNEKQDGNRNDGVLLNKATPRRPHISKEGLKETQDGNQGDGISLKEKNTNKPQISKKGLKVIRDGKCDNGILLKETSTVKPQISNGVFKKEVKTSGNTEGVPQREKNMKKMVPKGVSSNLNGCKKRKEQQNSRLYKGVEVLDGRKIDKDEAQITIVVESCKVQTDAVKFQNHYIDADKLLPQSVELTTVAGIDLPPEDVGHTLQFLEFCSAFEEAREPEYILRELTRGGRGCRGKYSPVVKFHIQLLSLIKEDMGEDSTLISPQNGKNSWVHALENCASRSQCVLKELKLDWFGRQADDYDNLDSSKRLRLLTYLCDEVLCTAKMRSWIDDQNLKFIDKVKESKELFIAAKHKEKQVKQKMLDEVAKAIIAKNGAPLSISEHEAVVSKIKTEAAQAHAEMLESKDMLPNDKQRSDAVRTEPILSDNKGRTYWRLKGYSDNSSFLLQDVGTEDAVGSGEKWFTFDVAPEKEIEKYIDSLR